MDQGCILADHRVHGAQHRRQHHFVECWRKNAVHANHDHIGGFMFDGVDIEDGVELELSFFAVGVIALIVSQRISVGAVLAAVVVFHFALSNDHILWLLMK